MLTGTFPIKWFGDREAYYKSPIRIATVGLNPSHIEFKENSESETISSLYRFPDYDEKDPSSLEIALNNYFKRNPYSWFYSFEHILNGMNASYWGKGRENTALHTDFCTPWATDPTWNELSQSEKESLMQEGVPEWKALISELNPDVLLFSIPRRYAEKLALSVEPLCSFDRTKNGKLRNRPIVIAKGKYNNALAVFGSTWNLPFGALGKSQKEELGREILKTLNK